PEKQPVPSRLQGMPRPGCVVQMLEKTAIWSPSRNISLGQPSMSSFPLTARLSAGQLVALKSRWPERTKMRVPSFLTKSASSTPATCVLVVVYDAGALAGAAEGAGAPPAETTTPPEFQDFC